MEFDQKWNDYLKNSYFAYQPIVNIHSGKCFGFEALLRGLDQMVFPTIDCFFDAAFQENILDSVDLYLMEKAIDSYQKAGLSETCHLFYNLDNRLLVNSGSYQDSILLILSKHNLPSHFPYFEISERMEIPCFNDTRKILAPFRNSHLKIALDDFGTGYSGLQLLYFSEPDIIKIDRFFISNIDRDSRKKLFIGNMVNMAHVMGIKVLAEGVENIREYYACKDIGCDLIQGFLVQYPQSDIHQLKYKYDLIETLAKEDKRKVNFDQSLILNNIEEIEPIQIQTEIWNILDRFKKNKQLRCLPVVNSCNEPAGVIREESLKDYVYSPYGKEILKNKTSGKNILHFVTLVPTADIHSSVEKILEIFHIKEDSEGIIITESGIYKGFLDPKALLYILNEKELSAARELNPLTKLPGNISIEESISNILEEQIQEKVLVYFDFDHFKPFNDHYGFRQGDRAIVLFSEILKELTVRYNLFVGHIGGDDFFAVVPMDNFSFDQTLCLIQTIIQHFGEDVLAFYNSEDRINGYIMAQNREGRLKKYPLLSVSAGCVYLKGNNGGLTSDTLGHLFAQLKKKSKLAREKIAWVTIENDEQTGL